MTRQQIFSVSRMAKQVSSLGQTEGRGEEKKKEEEKKKLLFKILLLKTT